MDSTIAQEDHLEVTTSDLIFLKKAETKKKVGDNIEVCVIKKLICYDGGRLVVKFMHIKTTQCPVGTKAVKIGKVALHQVSGDVFKSWNHQGNQIQELNREGALNWLNTVLVPLLGDLARYHGHSEADVKGWDFYKLALVHINGSIMAGGKRKKSVSKKKSGSKSKKSQKGGSKIEQSGGKKKKTDSIKKAPKKKSGSIKKSKTMKQKW